MPRFASSSARCGPTPLIIRTSVCRPSDIEASPSARPRNGRPLEVGTELTERRKDNEFAGPGHDRFVFHVPGVLVGDVHSVQADFHGGIDVTARAIADHPALRFYDFVFIDQAGISDSIFFWHDLDCFKKALQARALHLGRLFRWFTLREKNQAVPLG